jgi:uncharacterized membrane protein YgaE (UPF0421/DUF939 family)
MLPCKHRWLENKPKGISMIGYADRILSPEQIRQITTLLMAAFVVLTTYGMSINNASAANIYDARILQRMKFTAVQRPKVRRIIRQSDKEIAVVFRKYRINPNAKPVFEKLQRASSELQAIESKEKRQMKKILSPDQYKTYLGLLQATAARVIKATRTKP